MYLYLLVRKDRPGYFKVGISKNVIERFDKVCGLDNVDAVNTMLVLSSNYKHLERIIHKSYDEHRTRFYDEDGGTEWFNFQIYHDLIKKLDDNREFLGVELIMPFRDSENYTKLPTVAMRDTNVGAFDVEFDKYGYVTHFKERVEWCGREILEEYNIRWWERDPIDDWDDSDEDNYDEVAYLKDVDNRYCCSLTCTRNGKVAYEGDQEYVSLDNHLSYGWRFEAYSESGALEKTIYADPFSDVIDVIHHNFSGVSMVYSSSYSDQRTPINKRMKELTLAQGTSLDDFNDRVKKLKDHHRDEIYFEDVYFCELPIKHYYPFRKASQNEFPKYILQKGTSND